MNILIVNERFIFRFGADRALLLLGKHWASWGHQVTFLGYRMDEDLIHNLGAESVKIAPPDREINDHALHWLQGNWASLYPSGPPDVIFFACWPLFKSIPFFKTTGASVIFFDCGAVPIEGQAEGNIANLQYLAQLRKRYLVKCDGIIAISDFIKRSQSLLDSGGAPLCLSVHLGTDHLENPLWQLGGQQKIETQQVAERILQRCAEQRLHLIFSLGRWEGGYKNSSQVLEFISALQQSRKDFLVVCLGERPEMAMDPLIESSLEFLGFPADDTMLQIMRHSKMGICFSRWEGFNLPLAEMQWIDKPVLVYDLAAHPEVAAHPAALCQDLTEMVGKASSILSRTWLPLSEWAAACETFRNRFTWEACARNYLDAILRIKEFKAERDPLANGWMNRTVIVDVTNATKDPANSGVIRVTRRFCRTLQACCDPVFVVWNPEYQDYVLPTLQELGVLGTFGGPSLPAPAYIAEHPGKLLDWDAISNHSTPSWLIFTETINESNARIIRQKARTHGLLAASIFYDAIALIHPEYCNEEVATNHGRYIFGLSFLDVTLPISQFSADCLRGCWDGYDIGPRRIAPNLLPGEFGGSARITSPPVPSEEVTILCVSTLEPRKNHANLIAACQKIGEAAPALKWRLIMVGNRYAGKLQISEDIEQLCRQDARFEWLGIVDDERLRRLYAECSFTVYPSLIEGFGMPILESLWFGKPCICHQEGVMAELARDGGCYPVDVTSPASLRDAIVRLATDTGLWSSLSGEARQRSFTSWRDYTEKFLHVLQETQDSSLGQLFHHVIYPECLTSGWQMNESERTALTALLCQLKPQCAIEIGTYKGGSLSLLSQQCKVVFSIDIDAAIPNKFSYFKNVSFLTGMSTEILPVLQEELAAREVHAGLILVDGDHSEDGVRDDINLILSRPPEAPCVIIMHDSWNPVCRRGLLAANWGQCPHVHYVDLDWVPGRIIENGSTFAGEVWGGLALAYLHPARRASGLVIRQTSQRMQAMITEKLYH